MNNNEWKTLAEEIDEAWRNRNARPLLTADDIVRSEEEWMRKVYGDDLLKEPEPHWPVVALFCAAMMVVFFSALCIVDRNILVWFVELMHHLVKRQ